MCRFLIYKGRELFMADLLVRSEQSLIRQSFQARERKEPLNGDGFGIGWYVPEVDPTPCVFTSTTPAWSNRNLHRLAEKIRSTCFFAHVRAASRGSFVSEVNCHPFQYEQFMWMHNGSIGEFPKIKRRLRESLSDETYNLIQGTTDSEHVFALFLENLRAKLEDYSQEDLLAALQQTIGQVKHWCAEAAVARPCYLNFAVTDGLTVLACRYVDNEEVEPASLYLAVGERFESIGGSYRMSSAEHEAHAVIVASEPLTEYREDWHAVARNHMVLITPEMHIRQLPIVL